MNPASAMFLYLFFILGPAAAVAQCNETATLRFVDISDTNKDYILTRAEINNANREYDANDDRIVTRQEIRDRIRDAYPTLRGGEDALFEFYEIDRDGEITSKDLDRVFVVIDENQDGDTSRDEYKR
ncbi:hypothetical protein BsWGS_07037 [Bradybaena similaris]